MDTWLLLQLADSAFPTGGFAHSGGLEATLQLGRLEGPEGLAELLDEALWSLATSALPFTVAAFRRPSELAALDRRCDASLPGHVANRASRSQGQAFLRAAGAAFGDPAERIAGEIRAHRLPGHLAPVLGAVLAGLGADEQQARQLLLFQGARTLVSAAVRLGVVGPLQAQELLAGLAGAARRVLAAADPAPEEAASSAPLLDLLQGHQDRLYSRLFQS